MNFSQGEASSNTVLRKRPAAPRTPLGQLIRPAMAQRKLTVKATATRIGVDPSYLSRALDGTRSLSDAKLIELADVLGVSRNDVFTAAGKILASDGPDVKLLDVAPLIHRPAVLRVVVDPHYIDSALLWWLVSKQPFRSVGVECLIEKASWPEIPMRVGGDDYAIGLFNKKLAPPTPTRLGSDGKRPFQASSDSLARELIPVCHWADLCLYTGYALVGRADDVPPGEDARGTLTYESATRMIELVKSRCKREKRRPTLIAMSESTAQRLMTPLSEHLLTGFDVHAITPSYRAVTLFREGRGDFFAGGIAQRLSLRNARFVEVLHSDNDPFLVSIASLFASRKLIWQRRDLVQSVAGLWYEMVRKMRQRAAYREAVADEILALAARDGEVLTFTADVLREVLRSGAMPYGGDDAAPPVFELLADRPSGIVDSLLRMMVRAATSNPQIGVERFAKAFERSLVLDSAIPHMALEPEP